TWGDNSDNQLGNGLNTQSNSPVAVTIPSFLLNKTVVAITSGALHDMALCSDGTLAAWGYNDDGELGNNSTTNSSAPIAVNLSSPALGERVVSIKSGSVAFHNIAIVASPPVIPNVSLSSLSINSGTLSPAFSSATLTYSDSVPFEVTSVTVT